MFWEGLSSVKSYIKFFYRFFKTILPAAAKDVYYRDEIGNISTSHMRIQEDSVELDLRPRFPLFGGWKTHYTLGYNIPSYEHLYYSGRFSTDIKAMEKLQLYSILTRILLIHFLE